MYVGKCEFCGAEIVSKFKSKQKRFCNKSCAAKFKKSGRILTDEKNWEQDINGEYVCPYNPECRCYDRACYKCGWNPPVAKARLGKVIADIWEESKCTKSSTSLMTPSMSCTD